MSVLPWPQLLAAAARMGMPPDAFWRMSLKEWRLLHAAQHDRAMAHEQLQALAVLYPDNQGDRDGGR
jgi:hypothetical protein